MVRHRHIKYYDFVTLFVVQFLRGAKEEMVGLKKVIMFNPLALELDIYSLAHHLYKM